MNISNRYIIIINNQTASIFSGVLGLFNAAIMVYTLNTLPKILNFFVVPRIDHIIELNVSGDAFRIIVINCPYSSLKRENDRIGKALRDLCFSNDIHFIVAKHNKQHTEDEHIRIEYGVERGNTDEIKGIKNLAVLIKLSAERNENLLKKSMGFIADRINYDILRIVSDEAATVMVYSHDKMDIAQKNKVFEMLMAEKGISVVFTNKLERIMKECDILFVDESFGLRGYEAELPEKLIIGSTPAEGGFRKIQGVLLWFEELHNLTQNNPYVLYNDEILTVLRHFYKDKNYVDIIRRFPHIYMWDE